MLLAGQSVSIQCVISRQEKHCAYRTRMLCIIFLREWEKITWLELITLTVLALPAIVLWIKVLEWRVIIIGSGWRRLQSSSSIGWMRLFTAQVSVTLLHQYIVDDRVYITLHHLTHHCLSLMKDFCVQVKEVANRVSCARGQCQAQGGKEATGDDKSRLQKRADLIERARLRKLSEGIPIGQRDVDLISEYISLLEEERINFDMLPIYKLAYHVSLKAGATRYPPQEWAEKYLEFRAFKMCQRVWWEFRAVIFANVSTRWRESTPMVMHLNLYMI